MKHEHFDTFSSEHINTAEAQSRRGNFYTKFGKRCLDLGLILAAVPLLVPVVTLLYVLVKLDGGPGFFAHKRVGRKGTSFGCLKLRTMVPNAEEILAEVLASDPEAQAEWDRDQKLSNDPRVTKIGNILRKTSLDELPQLWNVVRGDMSLVGPRPVTEPELDRYGAFKAMYLDMTPGVTGLWQVSGRNDVSYDQRLQLDREYYETTSLGRDLSLILRTVVVMLKRTGK